MTWRLPDTYHSAGHGRGTATLKFYEGRDILAASSIPDTTRQAATGQGREQAVSSGEEDDMSDTTPALDEAFERMAAASFELPNGFVNHGAMACEALAVLDCADDIG